MAEVPPPPVPSDTSEPSPSSLFWTNPSTQPSPPPPPFRNRPYVARPFIRRYKREDRYDFCTICQETFTVGELINVLPCRHVFHISCIGEWLSGYRHCCPLCQQWTLPARPRRHNWRRHRRWRRRRRRQNEAREPQPTMREYRQDFWFRPMSFRTNN